MAVKVQAVGRAFVTRRWCEGRYNRAYFKEIERVAATKISSVARMRREFVKLMGRKRQWWAASYIAGRYRQYTG